MESKYSLDYPDMLKFYVLLDMIKQILINFNNKKLWAKIENIKKKLEL